MRCVILDDYQNVALTMADWHVLEGRVDTTTLTDHIADRTTLAAALEGAAIVVAMRERTRFDRDLLAALPELRLLVTTGMRNAAIDLAAAAERGITVAGTAGSSGATAELAWGLILALLRHIPAEHRTLQEGGRWQRTIGAGLEGRTLGIVGLGKLGTRMVHVAKAFGMDVLAWSRSLSEAQAETLGIRRAATLDALLPAADIVTLHLTLTAETRGIVGARELGLMRPDAWLVNTARGPLVDERALVAVLRERRLAGAGLDVYDVEPLSPGHPLRSLDNVVLTPHLGYVTEETYRTYFPQVVEAIDAWLKGTPVRVLAAPHE
jgi:phosphoglycerate dehydrogenase-like enzyme